MLLAAACAAPVRAAWAQAAGTPLIDAAARGDLAAAQRAVQAGVPLEARDASGRTALLAATQGGHASVARWLIERGADVNAQDSVQDSAFLLAGARGHTEIVRAAHAVADPKVLNRYGGTALIPACHYGHVETVRALLEYRGPNKVPIDHVNRLGWTALLEAVILGDGGPRHTEIVRLLIQHGANVNLADSQGVTPLTHARQRQQRAIATLLEKAGGR
ncbi:MAG: ankyrin repeat domain-containing protein [Rubrivivax sp.]|nr:ankyrin repeat domain-containing protein [Rubrivivax sp.]